MLLLDSRVDSEEFILVPFPDEFFIPFGLRFRVYKDIRNHIKDVPTKKL